MKLVNAYSDTIIYNRLNKHLLTELGDYKVFVVDDSNVRASALVNDEFNAFGTHLQFPSLIPAKEIWISQHVEPHEYQFLICNSLNQYYAHKNGISDWYNYALKKERQEREKVDGYKFDPSTPVPKELYYKIYCEIPADSVTVWLVDGNIVRDIYKTDFVLGGNCEVYKWIPDREIWVEKTLTEADALDTILHEFVESTLMREKGYSYNKAHNIALKVDWKNLNKIDKESVEQLSTDYVFDIASPYLKS